MCALPAARQLVSGAAVALLLTPTSALGTEVEVRVPPDAPPPDLVKDGLHSDPALETGWVRTVADQSRCSAALTRAPGALRAPRDADGALWARVAFGGGVRGWVPVTALRSVPGLRPLSPGLRRSLTRLSAKAGPRSSVIIRDRWGRTLYAAGTRRPWRSPRSRRSSQWALRWIASPPGAWCERSSRRPTTPKPRL